MPIFSGWMFCFSSPSISKPLVIAANNSRIVERLPAALEHLRQIALELGFEIDKFGSDFFALSLVFESDDAGIERGKRPRNFLRVRARFVINFVRPFERVARAKRGLLQFFGNVAALCPEFFRFEIFARPLARFEFYFVALFRLKKFLRLFSFQDRRATIFRFQSFPRFSPA